MPYMFRRSEWNEKPPEVHQNRDGSVRVVRNVESAERDGATIYVGECAVMSESAYAAYVGAREVAQRREQEIMDETILALIEEGSL